MADESPGYTFGEEGADVVWVPTPADGFGLRRKRRVDAERYVGYAGVVAEAAKLEHRNALKETQRAREAEAEAAGRPLSAKEKERERSRRESAVTRKRTEVYIAQLENAARKVPELEAQVAELSEELCALKGAEAMRDEPAAVKPEPCLSPGASSASNASVLSGFKRLDL